MTRVLHIRLPRPGALAIVASTLLIGCRGTISDAPPVHISPNMDNQERFDPQAANAFYADGRAMRTPVPGTVARGFLREDVKFFFGREENGALVNDIPLPVTMDLLRRGRDRYNIYCSPCHGPAGDGQGAIMVGNYGYVPAPTYHSDALRSQPDGYLYNVVVNGVRTMPGYGTQVPVADRWAIVAYVRALQRSQNADRSDVPEDVLARMQ